MAVGRASVTPITRVTGSDERTIVVITGVVVAGFAVFWFAHAAWLATVGLLVVGLAVALMYPLTAARYVATAPAGSTRASARAALGSGVAIGVAPFVLATISDASGLHGAYLLVPALCAALVLNTWLLHRSTAGWLTTTSSRKVARDWRKRRIEEGVIPDPGGARRGRAGPAGHAAARPPAPRPKRTSAPAAATKTHVSAHGCDQNARQRAQLPALSCVLVDLWPKRTKAAGADRRCLAFWSFRRRSRAKSSFVAHASPRPQRGVRNGYVRSAIRRLSPRARLASLRGRLIRRRGRRPINEFRGRAVRRAKWGLGLAGVTMMVALAASGPAAAKLPSPVSRVSSVAPDAPPRCGSGVDQPGLAPELETDRLEE